MRKNILALILAIFFLAACGHPSHQRREYQEVSVLPSDTQDDTFLKNHPFLQNSSKNKMGMQNPEVSQMLKASLADVSLSWQRPKGWTEEAGSGLRLVTFKSTDEDSVECSIVSLGGMAGGLEANISRWLGQINISLSPEELAQFIGAQEKITLPDKTVLPVLNFTALQADDPDNTASMIASILEKDGKTVFIKMTGTKKSVSAHLQDFKSLLKSLTISHDTSATKN